MVRALAVIMPGNDIAIGQRKRPPLPQMRKLGRTAISLAASLTAPIHTDVRRVIAASKRPIDIAKAGTWEHAFKDACEPATSG
jgi:hypothetical protein